MRTESVLKYPTRIFAVRPKVGEIVTIASTSDAYPVWWKPWTWLRRPIDGSFKVVDVTPRSVTLTASCNREPKHHQRDNPSDS